MHSRLGLRFSQISGNFQQHRAACPVINGRPGNSVWGQFHDMRLVNDRRSHFDTGVAHRISAIEAGIDIELAIGDDLIFFVRSRRVMALVGDHAHRIPPFADLEQNRLRQQSPLRNTPHPFDANKPVRLNFSDHKPKLIHMGEQHHRRRVRIAFQVAMRFPKRSVEVVSPCSSRSP